MPLLVAGDPCSSEEGTGGGSAQTELSEGQLYSAPSSSAPKMCLVVHMVFMILTVMIYIATSR